MADIVVLGAGLSGTLMAFEMKGQLRKEDRLIVVNRGDRYHFVPSNPWVGVGWRKRPDIEIDLKKVMDRTDIALISEGAKRVHPDSNSIELENGKTVAYDYLVIASGPELAFDEIEGLGPDGFTHSVCHVDHAERAFAAIEALCRTPGPVVVGAVQGASCFGPAYEFAMLVDTELRRRKVRDRVPMTFVTSEPYIGHLGLDGVGDTKSTLEHELRQRHIKWITSARVTKVSEAIMSVEEIGAGGAVTAAHDLPFAFSMMLPAFRGIGAIRGIDKLCNPRGFVITDQFQRNPSYPNVFAVGVCVAIPPVGQTPVPVGVPKTGFMIESMVTATANNIGALLRGDQARSKPTLNAICLADFGDGGVAFVAQPQIPPRNVNWSAEGKWVHVAKVAFEKFFLAKMRRGTSEHVIEKFLLERLNIHRVKPGAA
jgi:sulfide:quinone oxidoreductase